MRVRACTLLVFGAVCLFPLTARADVDAYLGKPIASVHLQTEGRDVVEPALLQVVETLIGMPLSMVDVRESITHLFSFGRFEDVRVHASASSSGVDLVYDLVPVHPIDRVVFTGANGPGIDVGQLRQLVLARAGTSPSVGRAADLARVVAEELGRRGYLHAIVTPRAELRHDPDRATLAFTVDPGARTRVGSLAVAGTSGISQEALLGQLRLKTGMPYEREAINARIERYLSDRRGRGYLAARLAIGSALTDSDRVANLTLNADQGPHVRLVFNGDALPADRRDELVPIAREGSADEDLLEDSSNRIEEYLRAQGYRSASAAHTREMSGDELLITFNVKKGPQFRLLRVEVEGAAAVPLSELQGVMRLREGDLFADSRLDAAVDGVRDVYRRQGFASARVDSGVEPLAAGARDLLVQVVVHIIVVENARTVVSSVRIEGAQAIPEASLRSEVGLQPGRPFVPGDLAIDRDRLEQKYADLGFQSATVESTPGLSADGTRADVVYTVREGAQIRVDHVLIVGNIRTKTTTIQRELQIQSGDPLGIGAVADGQRRLAALGLFRRARITAVAHGEGSRRDLLVTVEEAAPTTIGYGGGVEAGEYIRTDANNGAAVQHLEFAPRAFFEVARRNLFGGTRSVNLFTRISLRPKGGTTSDTGATTAGGGYGFSEYRVLGTFREPHLFGTRADGSLTGVTEQQRRASFNFARRGFTGEVARRISREVSVSGNYQIQRTALFDVRIAPADKLLVDRLFPQVRLSSFSSSVIDDTRDDTLNPTVGRNLTANIQVATRRIGSEVGLVKSYFSAQMFRTLPHTRGTVLASSARVGLATGLPRQVTDSAGNLITVDDLPASERFFAGGDTTVRGFALDQLGTPTTLDSDGFPIGGNGLVILNAELRAPVHGNFGVVGFLDAGNVFARAGDINLTELRSAVGFGLRYKSPIGPIRVDLGFKLQRRDIIPGQREGLTALHISLGQAF